MEKLIELLNEYKPLNKGVHYEYNNGLFIMYDGSGREIGTSIEDEILISKKYGFVKWLVENDKIDLDAQAMKYAKSDLSKFFAEWKDKGGMSDDYAMLLMLLAIQDKPVDFLISILK